MGDGALKTRGYEKVPFRHKITYDVDTNCDSGTAAAAAADDDDDGGALFIVRYFGSSISSISSTCQSSHPSGP